MWLWWRRDDSAKVMEHPIGDWRRLSIALRLDYSLREKR
jgi:hypothetical protein